MKSLLAHVAPLLLGIVAVLQMVILAQTSLSPWKLGGFGMYSGVDSVAARWIRAALVTDAAEIPIFFERALAGRPAVETFARAVRAMPTRQALADLGDVALNDGRVWIDCTPARLRKGDGRSARILPTFVRAESPRRARNSGCRRLVVTAMRLELWRYSFERETRRVVGEKLLEAGAVKR